MSNKTLTCEGIHNRECIIMLRNACPLTSDYAENLICSVHTDGCCDMGEFLLKAGLACMTCQELYCQHY